MISEKSLALFNKANNDALARRALIQNTCEAFYRVATAPLACLEQIVAAEEADPEDGALPDLFGDLIATLFSNEALTNLSQKSGENRAHHLALLKTLITVKPAIEEALKANGLDPESARFKEKS